MSVTISFMCSCIQTHADNLEANVEKASSDVVHANEQLGRAVVYKVRSAAVLHQNSVICWHPASRNAPESCVV